MAFVVCGVMERGEGVCEGIFVWEKGESGGDTWV